MPKSDNLKNRLDELFSSVDLGETTELSTTTPTKETAPADVVPAEVFSPPEVIPPPPVLGETVTAALATASAYENAFENSPFGIVVTSLAGHFLRVNEAFCKILGYSRAELEDANFQMLTYEEDRRIGDEEMRRMLRGEFRTVHLQKRYVHKDGHLVWVELNVSLTFDQANQPQFFVTTVQDLTIQHHTAALLEKRVQELNCLNDIGHKIDEKPPLPEFFTWLAQRVPVAFRDSEHCVAAIEYEGQVYGVPDAVNLPSKVVGGLRIGGDKLSEAALVGWIHVAYREPRDFADTESALMGSIVSRISSYIESQRLLQQTDTTLEQAQATRQLLSAVIDHIPSPVFFKDANGIYTGCNQAYLDYLGLCAEDVIGKGVYDLKIDRQRADQFYEMDQQLYQHPGVQVYEATVMYPDGSSHQVINNKATFTNPDGSLGGIVGVVVDITDLKLAEERLERQAQTLAILNDMNRALTATLDFDTVLRHIYEYASKLVDTTDFFIALYHEDTGEVSYPLVMNDGQPMSLQTHQLGNGLTEYIIRTRKPLLLSEYNDAEVEAKGIQVVNFGDDEPVYSWLGVPILFGDRVWGVIVVQSIRIPGLYTEHQRDMLEAVAAQAANAFTFSRQFEQIQATLAETEVLYQAGAEIQAAQSYDAILAVLLKHTSLSQDVYNVTVDLYSHPWVEDDVPEWVTPVARYGNMPLERVQNRYSLAAFPSAGKYLRPDAIAVLESVRTDPRLDEAARSLFLDQFQVECAVFAPLVVAGQWIGHLNALYKEPRHFKEEEIRRLTALSAQAAATIQNLRSLERYQAQVRREQALRELSTSVRSSLDVDTILRTAVRELGDTLGRNTFIQMTQPGGTAAAGSGDPGNGGSAVTGAGDPGGD